MSFRIGYMGLGAMGSVIAPNVADYIQTNNLDPLICWNRSQSKFYSIQGSLGPGARYVKTPGEVVKNCDVILTCLANDQAVEEVYGAVAEELRTSKGTGGEKKVFVDQSTIKPVTTRKIKQLVEEAGGLYLTSTIFGQPPAAKARQLVITLAGDSAVKEKARPLLDHLGKYVLDAGDDNAKGTALKLMGNSILLGAIQLYGEAYALGDAIGMDPKVFHELHQNLFGAPALLNYSNKISQGRFGNAGFTITNGLKDASYILSMGEELGHPVNLPTIERAQANMNQIKDMGLQDLDWSAFAAISRENAGLGLWREGTDDGKQGPK